MPSTAAPIPFAGSTLGDNLQRSGAPLNPYRQ
jgi:hypothetical protein